MQNNPIIDRSSVPQPAGDALFCRCSMMLICCVVGLSGCMNPDFVRYPTAMTAFPLAENIAYQRQDPFPDPDIGPSLGSTPRGYERPRSPARRAAEQRLFQGIPVGPEFVPPGAPRGGLSRPQAIY